MRLVGNRLQLAAYLLIVALSVTVAWSVKAGSDRQRHEERQRQFELCQQTNAGRQVVVEGFHTFTEVLIAASEQGEPGDTPADKERRRQQIAAFRAQVSEKIDARLTPIDCRAVLAR